MPLYSVFGGYFDTEVSFPELRPVDGGSPTWTLRIVDALPDAPDATLLAAYDNPVRRVSIYKWGRGFRVVYNDAMGSYDISLDGRQIAWVPNGEYDVEFVRMAIIGRVLPIALHAAGTLCLHGSAVAFDEGGVAFLAPKLHGKSTTALALATAGARLLSDDIVPVEPGHPVMIGPGVPSVRLWSDSAERVAGSHLRSRLPEGGKHIFEELPPEQIMVERVPLKAVYLLRPVQSLSDGAAVQRTSVAAVPAAIAIVGQLKVGAALGGAEAVVSFDRAVAVAQSVPVYTLRVVRDFARMPEVVEQIFEWHGQSAPSVETSAAS